MSKQTASLGGLSLFLVCVLSLTGCSSWNKPASASFASVTITGHTAEQIRDTATAVFRENGYTGSAIDARRLVFTREGTRLETISRDGVMAAQKGQSTLVRVKAELVDLGSGVYRLQCQTYMVTDAGQRREEETRLFDIRSGPYQKLLDEVGTRLK
jgi:hypothetical protein